MNVENLSFAYGEHRVLHDVSFSVEYGEFLSVLGPNGVGKSTLFRCMLGLLAPSSGAAYVDGRRVAELSARELAYAIAYIPQSHSPVFNYSVYDMVLMGTTAQTGGFASPGKRQRSLANKALDRLGIFHCSIIKHILTTHNHRNIKPRINLLNLLYKKLVRHNLTTVVRQIHKRFCLL